MTSLFLSKYTLHQTNVKIKLKIFLAHINVQKILGLFMQTFFCVECTVFGKQFCSMWKIVIQKNTFLIVSYASLVNLIRNSSFLETNSA